MNDWHVTHKPAEPYDTATSTNLIFCENCGVLLKSDRGLGTNAKVTAPCEK